MCHHNTFLVYQSMRNATLERWEKVTHVSIGFALAVAALFGIAGYSTFRALSQGDLLENYCWNDDLMNFSRVLFSVSILLTFPIECFVSREIVRALIHRFVLKEPISELTLDKDPNLEKGADIDEYSRNITLAIVLSAFIISPLTDCLGSVLELNITLGAAINQLDAKKFIADASSRYYKLYNQIAEETYTSLDDEDFETIFSKLTTVKRIAAELVKISEEAGEFDLENISDEEVKAALQNLRRAGGLFVLGEDYFSSVLINFAALKELSTDRDIEPYLGGANMPDQDGSPLAYYPDIQKIFQQSNDSGELKYYWESWREKNLVWSSVNFYTIVEAFQKSAKILDIPVLEFWFRCYNNKEFLQEMDKVMEEIKPAYKQLHAFVRRELYTKYGAEVVNPRGPIPDHLFQQVREQAWQASSVIEPYFPKKTLPPYDSFVQHFDPKEIIDTAGTFYTSLGFKELPSTFYQQQLKEQDESAESGDCRADIFDLTPHVYMKYCKKVDFRKFLQNHGYLGRVHYAKEKDNLPSYFFSSYDLEYPVGEAVILSASTPKHLQTIGLSKDFQFSDPVLMNRLFRMGIHTLLNIPLYFVHTKVMNDLFNGTVEIERINKHYWELMEKYAGVEPPSDRSENAIDFPYSFYMDMEQNHQTKKFVSEVLGYQFYRAFCRASQHRGSLHNCDFYDNVAIGEALKTMMSLGSSKPLPETLSKMLGNENRLSGDALLDYYAPLLDWLKTKNRESNVKIGWNPSQKKIL
ncbi:angiotensin-converting enzyme isoform X2 [Rhagoletis pomonella]|nr:angiotensin-converting enzyme isoform X2 [Rhagoletis pomonella]XP_036332784.1 angiotensin-converting enzyme isoform X2 [Rhagoletis pomonella]XP_036332787.1 angiotensin-converting enzyme isoform X2 [Rhagoletis pomonella]XP_036332788.1 angiotensin-converting enzyme isoform X2 [Rhagoletis pomonella]XP_036332789.1 angiotensin-converting enzyme isoform X2 [Rhagoletis pomonella]